MNIKTARICLALLVAAGLSYEFYRPFTAGAQSPAPSQAPVFEVDPFWPKPLPNHWVLGSTIGLSVDARDHVWVLHRPESVEDNLKAAAPGQGTPWPRTP